MTRASHRDHKRLEQCHRERSQLTAERRQLHAVFDSMMAERYALIRSLHDTAEASRKRRTWRTARQ